MSPESTPPAWVVNLLEGIRREMSEQHSQMRAEMANGFEAMREELQIQNGRVRSTEERVTKIEAERGVEDKSSGRQWPVVAMMAVALFTFVLQIIKAWVEK